VDCGPGDQCNDKECDDDADACKDVPKALSTPCQDGDDCTSFTGDPGTPDHCDGAGNCLVGIPVDCEFTIFNSFSGPDIQVTILLQTLDDGSGVKITVTETDSSLIGDIRGVFFHVKDESKLDTIEVTGTDGGPVTSSVVGPANTVQSVANDVRMNGDGNKHKYDVGVAIGNMGIAKDDDFQTTTFIVTGVTTADFTKAEEFGVRLTSVGPTDGSRGDSSKVYGYPDCTCPAQAPARRALSAWRSVLELL